MVCNCFCTKQGHVLVGSCHTCGLIVCSEDAQLLKSGCSFCGGQVKPPMSLQELVDQHGSNIPPGEVKAYQMKDKLLSFDKENAKRTRVHDAQGDYYSADIWLSEEEKKAIDEKQRKKRESRQPMNRKYSVKFDFAGRKQIIVENNNEEEDDDLGVNADPNQVIEELNHNMGLETSDSKAGGVYRSILSLESKLAPWRGATRNEAGDDNQVFKLNSATRHAARSQSPSSTRSLS